jgi:hypothetical protein
MKDYAKTGSKPGKPAYRTPSRFIIQQKIKTRTAKSSTPLNQGRVLRVRNKNEKASQG